MSDIAAYMDECMVKMLDEKAKAIPQLATNPKLRKYFELGFWCGAEAHGDALSYILEQKEKCNGVTETSENEENSERS